MKGKTTRKIGISLVYKILDERWKRAAFVVNRSPEDGDLAVAGKTVKVHSRRVRERPAGDGTDKRLTESEFLDWANQWDFHVFVRHDGKNIAESFVCSRGDYKDLIELHKTECGFNPYRVKTERKDGADRTKVKGLWKAREGEKGWKEMERVLNTDSSGATAK